MSHGHRAGLRLVAQSCLTLCDPVGCSPPGSSAHGLLQARILEWVAVPSSRGSSQLRDRSQVSHVAGRVFTICATCYMDFDQREDPGFNVNSLLSYFS